MIYLILFSLIFANPSCDVNGKIYYKKYNLIISEIDDINKETIMSFKNVFISSREGLFEYDFRLKTKIIPSEDYKLSRSSEDSFALSFIPQDKPFYYQFDFKGNLLKKDSIKYKSNDFFKIDNSNKKNDPLYTIINNLSEKNLIDTVYNGVNLLTYKHPQVIKDAVGEMTFQLFFTRDTLLKTPFNVNDRYLKPFNKYNLTGMIFTYLSQNRKMIIMISDIREIDKEEISLCNRIIKNISMTK